MSLTAEQRAAREGKMTASRVAVLMKGDVAGINRLYREMIGELAEEDLSHIWAVILGSATEQINLDRYEYNQRRVVVRRGEVVVHPTYEWAAATIDGWDAEMGCPVECKHVGGFEPSEVIIDRYQPQMQWQMACTGANVCMLSVIRGAAEPVVDEVPRSEPYINLMFERADHFMMCVALRRPPVDMPEILPPCEPTQVINMTGNNTWAHHAITWMANREFSKQFEDAKANLKALVPPEASRCFGHGIKITRDRRGALHIREDVS